MLIAGGVVLALIVVFALTRKPGQSVGGEYYDDDAYQAPAPIQWEIGKPEDRYPYGWRGVLTNADIEQLRAKGFTVSVLSGRENAWLSDVE